MTILISILIRDHVPAGPGECGCLVAGVWRHFIQTPDGIWHFSQLLSDTAEPASYLSLVNHLIEHPDRWITIPVAPKLSASKSTAKPNN